MASENHASYAKIGLTVALGIVAIVGTLIYLGGIRGSGDIVLVETYYDKPVTGLTVGSAVNFCGVKIGEVSEIALLGTKYPTDEKNMARIYILMSIGTKSLNPRSTTAEVEAVIRKLIIKRGMRATVKVNALTGLARMEMDFHDGEDVKNVPLVTWRPKHIYVPSIDSLMDSFAVAATKVMNQINKMDFNVFWSNLNSSVEHVSQSVEAANTLIQSRRADVDRIAENMMIASESIRELAAELRQNPSAVVRGVDREPLVETAR